MSGKKEITKQQQKLQKRSGIMELQDSLMKLVDGDNVVKGDSSTFPLKHTFTDGIYIRQMSMKKDSFVIGKIDHIAPCYVEAPSGSKRMIYAHEDSVWVNIHANPTNTQDLEELEELIIAKDYEEINNKK